MHPSTRQRMRLVLVSYHACDEYEQKLSLAERSVCSFAAPHPWGREPRMLSMHMRVHVARPLLSSRRADRADTVLHQLLASLSFCISMRLAPA